MTTVTTGTTIPVFVDFLQTTLLPVLREQKPDAILVMDNLSAHKNQAVKDAIAAAGLTAALPAPLFPRLLSHRALLVEDQDRSASRRGENR